jgi:hypothetical protein
MYECNHNKLLLQVHDLSKICLALLGLTSMFITVPLTCPEYPYLHFMDFYQKLLTSRNHGFVVTDLMEMGMLMSYQILSAVQWFSELLHD